MEIAVGVPEIAQVEVENEIPVGSAGLMAQELMVPPAFVGLSVVMRLPTVYVKGLPVKEIEGGLSFTVMLIEVVPDPPVFVAVTV
jgi:hypothetical protein